MQWFFHLTANRTFFGNFLSKYDYLMQLLLQLLAAAKDDQSE